MQPRLKHFGWGREGEGLTPAEDAFVLGRIERLFGPLTDDSVGGSRATEGARCENKTRCDGIGMHVFEQIDRRSGRFHFARGSARGERLTQPWPFDRG